MEIAPSEAVDAGPARSSLHSCLPAKILSERALNRTLRDEYAAAGLPRHVCDFLARRLVHLVKPEILLLPKLSEVADPIAIPTMDLAVDRVVQAIVEKERIALVCDHDMDGTASAAVLWSALVDFFGVQPGTIAVFTSHRIREGYGISDPVAERVAAFAPRLVITADQGSSDEPRIAILHARGIDVLVTDHHVIPEAGPPRSALAVVNPSRVDAQYDAHICGAGVAFLLMAKVRSALAGKGLVAKTVTLNWLLDFVAVATIADCVSLSPCSSLANRAFIRRGLALINSLSRPCWKVFAADHGGIIDAEAIAFRMAPAIAAAGRLDWADVGFRFLIAKTEDEARLSWEELKLQNDQRKSIELRLREQAFFEAGTTLEPAIVLLLEDGHAGVHGITASRVVEAFGKPCGIFAQKGGEHAGSSPLASGSFRSVPGIDVRAALETIDQSSPGLLIAFGGHTGAAGATILAADFERFQHEFNIAVLQQSGLNANPGPVVLTDGELLPEFHTLKALAALEAVGPFGRGFEAPTYTGTFAVRSWEALGNGKHAKARLERRDRLTLDAIWFHIERELLQAPQPGDYLKIAYRLRENRFGRNASLQAIIVAGQICPLPE